MDDLPGKFFFGRHPRSGVRGPLPSRLAGPGSFEIGDIAGQGIAAAVKNQVLGQLAQLRRNFGIRCNLPGIDHGQVHTGGHGMMEKDGVEGTTGRGAQAEGDVAHPQGAEDAGKFAFDGLDPLQSGHGAVAQVSPARGQGKGEGIEDQGFRGQAMFVDGEVIEAPGDFQFPRARSGPCRPRRWSGR